MSSKENPQVNPWSDSGKVEITLEDLTRSLIENRGPFLEAVLRELNFDSARFLELHKGNVPGKDALVSSDSIRVLEQTFKESTDDGTPIQDQHFLLGITHREKEVGEGLLSDWGISYQKARFAISSVQRRFEQNQAHINDYGYKTHLGSDFISPEPEPDK